MNILIVAYHYLPDISGGTERPKNFLYYLNEFGHNTYLLTTKYGQIDYSQDDDHIIRIKDYRKNDSNFFITAGIRIFQILMRRFGKPIRPEDFWLWNVKRNLEEIIERIKPEVCICTFPPPVVLDVAVYIKRKYPEIKLITDFRDGFLYEPMYTEMKDDSKLINRQFMKRYHNLERSIIKESDAIISASDFLTEYFHKSYNVKNLYTIQNGFNHEEYITEKAINLPDGKFTLLFTGGLDTSRDGLFEYFKYFITNERLNKLDIYLVMIGNYRSYEMEFFSTIDRIIVHHAKKRESIIATQRSADLMLSVTREDTPGAIGGKLYEYLFSEKPILNLGKNNIASKIIEETGAGKSFGKEEADEAEKYILEVKSGRYKRSGTENLYKYTRRAGAEALMGIINNVMNKRDKNSGG